MRILVFDQSTRSTGWAFDDDCGGLEWGTITSDRNERNPITRMLYMHDEAEKLIDKFKPDACVIEDTQFQNSQGTFQVLANLTGVFIALFHQRNLPFTIVPPNTWKSNFGVQGRKRTEQKASTMRLVKKHYSIDANEDEADALGILAWAKQKGLQKNG